MEYPVLHPAFAGRGLTVRSAGWFRGPRLVVDGAEVTGKRLHFTVRDNDGKTRGIRLKGHFLDPAPKVFVDDEAIEIARPLTWYEYAWMAIPIVLVFAGGALGAICGLLAVFASSRVFRSNRSTVSKFVLSLAISGAAVMGFIALVAILQLSLGRWSGG